MIGPDAHPIPGTTAELSHIQEIAAASSGQYAVVSRIGEDATKEHVLSDMADCAWTHLACHGIQDPVTPNKSRLKLFEGYLALSEIVNQSFANSELVFLSACQTATGDRKISEEAVHLAAGMLLAGYRSVVATMWSIPDQTTPQIVKRFYEQMLDGASPDCTQAAKSLHEAVRHLRESGVSLELWVPFIHLGV
jgi:CHAT domain-containing protein